MTPEWLAVLVSLLPAISFGYHLLRTFGLWAAMRSVHNYRDLFVASMIEVSMLMFVINSLARAVAPAASIPPVTASAIFTGYIVRGMLLVGAIFVPLSWFLRDQPKRES